MAMHGVGVAQAKHACKHTIATRKCYQYNTIQYMNKTKIDTTFHFVPIDEEQTLTIISQLKPKKSMGYDNISQILLHKSAKYLSKPLTCIINQSLITGIFPNKLKIARIIPI